MTTFNRLELLTLNYIAKSKEPLFRGALDKVKEGDSLFSLEKSSLIFRTRKGFIITNHGREFLKLNLAQLQTRMIALTDEEIHWLDVVLAQAVNELEPSLPSLSILQGIQQKLLRLEG